MYAYCNGNPVMYVDPSGMRARPILDAVKKVFPSTAPAVDALAGFLDKAEAGFDAFLGRATTFLETATEKLEKAVEVGQQLWTVVSPFVEFAYTLNSIALLLGSYTFNDIIPIATGTAMIVAGVVRPIANVIGAVFPAAMPVTAPIAALCTTVIQAGAFIIPASQFVGQLFDWGIWANDLFGALFGFGSYNVYGNIAIEAEPDMFPDYEYDQGMMTMSSPGGGQGMMMTMASQYEGTFNKEQVNLYLGQSATLTYLVGGNPASFDDLHTSNSDLSWRRVGKPNEPPAYAEITAKKSGRVVTVYAKVGDRKASNDVHVPIIASSSDNGNYAAAKQRNVYIYERPAGATSGLDMTVPCKILGEIRYSSLFTNYYYVRLPNGNNRFVKKSETITGPEPTILTAPRGPFMDDWLAAFTWANHVYSSSLYIRHEYGAIIYQDGTQFFLTETVCGSPHGVAPLIGQVSVSQMVAYVHTHPNSHEFSGYPGDMQSSDAIGKKCYLAAPTSYMGTSAFQLLRYTPPTGTQTEGTVSPPIGTIKLRNLSVTERIDLTATYQDSWNNHLLPCFLNLGPCFSIPWPTSPWPPV